MPPANAKKAKPEPITVDVFVLISPDGTVLLATSNESGANSLRLSYDRLNRHGRKRAVIRKGSVTV